ncbi:hypothetical protein GGR32_000935 [Mesonia hippocampi]|uniref:Uncharacterized protein n=1 Tax=Mesonia hippocampi TaxID=1628250 RepID=A0A840ENH8_9FLAO|nr:hypothetical protein [Mesonia hippocampi]MBB4118655.1 hypothetical protein [Mesonia hippocampi]
MKTFSLFLLITVTFFSFKLNAQTELRTWVDENGKSISENVFNEKWRTDIYSRWDYILKEAPNSSDSIKKSLRIAKLIPAYTASTTNHKKWVEFLSTETNTPIKTNNTIVISFMHKDDLCGGTRNHNTTPDKKLRAYKNFYHPIFKKLKKKNPEVTPFMFFEKGVFLNTSLQETPFFSDEKNVLKRGIFNIPALCGSYAIIKPNNQILVINGESRIDYIIEEYLHNEEYWNTFFKQ